MLNSYSIKTGNYQANNITKINAVSGTLVKNHPASFFMNVKLGSVTSNNLLCSSPSLNKKEGYGKDDVTVLQVMLVGDMQVLMEIVYNKDLA